ncbi:hypothetical protein OC835_002862 [Tilletia horrida]|nr:hypothetical protein OC835_002862 [Tilletia horrida]
MYSVYLAESPSKRQKRAHAEAADGDANKSGSSAASSGDQTLQQPQQQQQQPQAAASSSASSTSAGTITPAAHIEQLITEHLGFNPRVYIDQLTQLANDYLHQLKGPIEEEVRAKLLQQGSRPDAELEAEQGVHALVTLIENALDHTFDTYELYCLRSVFRITPAQARAITLAHHRGLDLRSVEEKRAHLERMNNKKKKSKSGAATKAGEEEEGGEEQVGPVLSVHEQSRALAERAVQLRKKIAATRATNAALRAATVKSKHELDNLLKFEEQLPSLFGIADDDDDDVAMHEQQDGQQPAPAPTGALSAAHPELAMRVQGATNQLLDAILTLKEVDPLGTALVEKAGADGTGAAGTAGEGEGDQAAAAGGTGLPWTTRESYLKFVADKARP